jgi:hypothetical protein
MHKAVYVRDEDVALWESRSAQVRTAYETFRFNV